MRNFSAVIHFSPMAHLPLLSSLPGCPLGPGHRGSTGINVRLVQAPEVSTPIRSASPRMQWELAVLNKYVDFK